MTASMSDMIISPYSPMAATPPAVSSLLLPEVPAWMWLAAAWLIGIGLAFVAGYRSKPTRLTIISTLVMAGSFLVLIYFTWASDGIELARHQAPWVLFAIVAGLTVPVATVRNFTISKTSVPISH
jgi:hypothetical protein